MNVAKLGLAKRKRVFERDGYRCRHCGGQVQLGGYRKGGALTPEQVATVDHVVPLSADGTSRKENLQTLCLRCNMRKSTKTMTEFRVSTAGRPPGPPFWYYQKLAPALGVKQAILLSLFLMPRVTHDGWFAKWADEIEAETSLTYRQQRRVRADLVTRGLIEEHYTRSRHRMYFRVDPAALNALTLQPQRVPRDG
jgi:hypothetical protein